MFTLRVSNLYFTSLGNTKVPLSKQTLVLVLVTTIDPAELYSNNRGAFLPLLVLLGLAQDLQRSSVGVPLLATPAAKIAAASEEATPAVGASEAPGCVDQLEGALVFLVIVGVLGAAGSELAGVLADVAPVGVGRSSPVRNLKLRKGQR